VRAGAETGRATAIIWGVEGRARALSIARGFGRRSAANLTSATVAGIAGAGLTLVHSGTRYATSVPDDIDSAWAIRAGVLAAATARKKVLDAAATTANRNISRRWRGGNGGACSQLGSG
jgi:hypothetical protein